MHTELTSSILADWHAEPMTAEQARALLNETHQLRKQAILSVRPCVMCGCYELQAGYWLGKPVTQTLELAVQTESDQAQVALLTLVYGQLLLACKLQEAFKFLDRGLTLAAGFLSPGDYFKVVNRHELLSVLPLFTEPHPPAGLATLENEAQILSRLKQGQPRLTGNSGRTPQR